MLSVRDLHKHFGGFHAVDGASLDIAKGSITGLIGPNGAGKTTLFNVIAGRLKPTSGTVTMDGEDITGLPPHDLFHKGLLRTFQIAHEFSSMTVRENLMMVPAAQTGESLWNAWFARGRIREEEAALREKADGVLDFLTISHLAMRRQATCRAGRRNCWNLVAP
jgi:branched-chain amino acid transport system ATP-binding protein